MASSPSLFLDKFKYVILESELGRNTVLVSSLTASISNLLSDMSSCSSFKLLISLIILITPLLESLLFAAFIILGLSLIRLELIA